MKPHVETSEFKNSTILRIQLEASEKKILLRNHHFKELLIIKFSPFIIRSKTNRKMLHNKINFPRLQS
jgi:hypothetical protein